jgi:hypothetical protein
VASEDTVSSIFHEGIYANEKNQIILIALKDDFIMKKFVLDVYAHEELGTDTYCAFEVSEQALEGPLFEAGINSIFSDSFRICMQPHIERKHIQPFKTEDSYHGMGLIEGVFPVENKDKFTDQYKRKVLDYLKEIC